MTGNTETINTNTTLDATTLVPMNESSKQAIRDAIFSKKAETRIVQFMGTKVELRQPALGESLSIGELAADEDRKVSFVNTLIRYVYVPGTNDKVFTEDDFDALLQLPFGPDFKRLIDEFNELMGVGTKTMEDNVKSAEKSADESAS